MQAEDKRAKILKAAIKVFAEKGFHEAKVDEIAKLADVGKGTVYEYFSSKTELFQEMCKFGMVFYMDKIARKITEDMSCREKLNKIARLHADFMIKHSSLAKIIFNENTYFEKDFREWLCQQRQKKIDLISQIVASGVEKGEFKEVDPTAAALSFLGINNGWMHLVFFSNQVKYPASMMQKMLDILFDGFAK